MSISVCLPIRLSLVAVLVCSSTVVAGAQDAVAPEPEEITLETRDGVTIKATYYPSKRGKDAVPVVLLHDFARNRHELSGLAQWLQSPELGYAVIVPDLRGHGESIRQKTPRGTTVTLEADKLRIPDFKMMVIGDLEAVRKFLIEENDKGKLNLNKLCVVGAGMGATIAANWTAADWSAPILAVGKQGQDIKALVMIAPTWSFKGLPVRDAFSLPAVRQLVSLLIVYAKPDKQGSRDAERIHKMVAKFHPDYEPKDPEWKEKQDLFLQPVEQELPGTTLLTDARTGVANLIRGFIDLRLVNQEYEWIKRSLD